MKYLAVALASGCAMTATTCPVGSKLTVTYGDHGRGEFCALDTVHAPVIAPGRDDGVFARPQPVTGGVDGPYTAWYPSGVKAARGTYRSAGRTSLPEGLWAFWSPDARLQAVGHYHHGEPVGCFAMYDEKWVRHSGTGDPADFHEQTCAPPSDQELAALEGTVPERPHDPWGDAAVDVLFGPTSIGASASGQDVEHGMTLAISGRARKYLGRLRLGPFAQVRVGDDAGDSAYAAGAGVAWQLPRFHPRIDTEIGAELGFARILVNPERGMKVANDPLVFWSTLPALQATFAFALSPMLAATAALRAEGVPAFGVTGTSTYCSFTACDAPTTETWNVGGFAYGVTFGLRMQL